MMYTTCPGCGSNLDFGEKCDCFKRDKPEHMQTLLGGTGMVVIKRDPDCRKRYKAALERSNNQRRLS